MRFLLLAVPLLLVVAYQINASYRAAKDAASVNAQNLTSVIDSRLTTDFGAAVRSVTYVVEQVQLEAMQPKLAEQYRARSTQLLKSQVHSVGSASAMRIFAANGDRLYSSIDGETSTNISDRNFFSQLKENPGTNLIFSEVVLGRYTRRASMYVVKPIRGENAAFLGVAVTAIDLTTLHEELQKLNLGSNGVVALRRLENGALVVRYPGVVEVDNSPAPNIPLLHAIRTAGHNGTLEFKSPVDSINRIYAYSTVGDAPLFVAVGLAEMDCLAEWQRKSVIMVVAVLLLLAVLAATLARLARSEASRNAHEVDLRDSETRFRTLFSHNRAVILQMSAESGAIVDANAAATEFYGWSHQQLCSMNIADINLLDAEQLAAEREAAVNEQRNYFVFSHRLASGDIRTVEVHSTPIRVNDRPLLVSIIHDITERVRGAEQIESLLQEQSAILNGHLIGFVKLKDRKFVWCNDDFAEMLGYTKEELVGLATRILYSSDQAHAEFAEAAYPLMQRGEVFRSELQLVRKDGSFGWYELSGGLIRPGSPESIWVFLDIHARKLAELDLELHKNCLEQMVFDRTAALTIAKEAAETANRAKTIFLSNISHELRTPMNGIMGMTGVAIRRITDPRAVELLGKAMVSAERLLLILNNLIDISRLEAERFTLEREPFMMDGVLEDIQTLISYKAREKGLQLNLEIAAVLTEDSFFGDPVRLRQVLATLTENAIKFTDAGSVTLRAQIVSETAGDSTLRFEVQDTGIGIALEDQRRLFTVFEQVDGSSTRKYGGTGLGLAICKRLVEMMGGSIGLTSQPGGGSTFWLTVRLDKTE